MTDDAPTPVIANAVKQSSALNPDCRGPAGLAMTDDTPTPVIANAVKQSSAPNTQVFDHASALARVNGSDVLLKRFLSLFRERNGGLVGEIDAALAGNDLETARRLAHSLKGGAGTVGLLELQDAATQLEATLTLALEGDSEPGRRGADFAQLAATWPRAMAALAEATGEPAANITEDNHEN